MISDYLSDGFEYVDKQTYFILQTTGGVMASLVRGTLPPTMYGNPNTGTVVAYPSMPMTMIKTLHSSNEEAREELRQIGDNDSSNPTSSKPSVAFPMLQKRYNI